MIDYLVYKILENSKKIPITMCDDLMKCLGLSDQ